jgi:type II secretory pathway pseudopilin PulG
MWERVLSAGYAAAHMTGRERDEAFMLHELGSRAMCIGDEGTARGYLLEALGIRDRIGDEPGAELTRHNLSQLGGGPPPPHPSGNGGLPPTGPALLVALALAAIVAAVLLLGGGSSPDDGQSAQEAAEQRAAEQRAAEQRGAAQPGERGSESGGGGGTVTPGEEGEITITISAPSGTYLQGDRVFAVYECTIDGEPADTCDGDVADSAPIDTSEAGTYQFTVTSDGGATETSTYVIMKPETEPAPPVEKAPEPAVPTPAPPPAPATPNPGTTRPDPGEFVPPR